MGQTEILTKTSSRDHSTSMLTRTADGVNCEQCWYTSSYLPPTRSTSMREETLVIIPRLGFTAPHLSTTKSSEKEYSPSLTTKAALIILYRFRSKTAGLMAFPSGSNSSQPGVSNLKHWSREKFLLSWKCGKSLW